MDPSIYVILPSYDDLVDNEGLVTCLVLGYSIAGAQVSWEVDGKASSLSETGAVVTQDNGTQSVTSTHRITLTQWKTRTRFTCNVVLPCSREVRQDAPTMDMSEYLWILFLTLPQLFGRSLWLPLENGAEFPCLLLPLPFVSVSFLAQGRSFTL